MAEFINGHRLPNQDASYIRVTEEDRLPQYSKAIPLLTISNNQRLEQENHDPKTIQGQEIARLTQEIERLRRQLQEQGERHSDEYEDIRRTHREMEEQAIEMRKQLNEISRPHGAKFVNGRMVDIATNERVI